MWLFASLILVNLSFHNEQAMKNIHRLARITQKDHILSQKWMTT
jgi:hypothetical protein